MGSTYIPPTFAGLGLFYNFFEASTLIALKKGRSQQIVIGNSSVTYPNRGDSNINIGYYRSNNLFYIQAVNTNGIKGSVNITYPWSQTTSTTNGIVGNYKQAWTGSYTYITLTVTTKYGYSFNGWYTAATGGSLLSISEVVNVYYNSYPGNISTWYARWN